MNRLLIVGCGELGSRFLQAATFLDVFTEINIIEPNFEAIAIAKNRFLEIKSSNTKIVFFSNILDIKNHGDFAIIATQANIRQKVYNDLIKYGYKKILLEKIVTQSIIQYQEMLNLAELNNVNVWVNCKTRCYPIWKYIKSKININDKIHMFSIGGNHGLCTNGIHTIDLFFYLTNCTNYTFDNIDLDQYIFKTKRDQYDTSGSFIISDTATKSKLSISYDNNHFQMPIEIIFLNNYKWVVDIGNRQIFEFDLNKQNKFIELPFVGNLAVSEMSKTFISDILFNNNCNLPTLNDCYLAHKSLFEITLPHFKQFKGIDNDLCPIT
jgi:hypothetical protein